jgi:hypothetical protein
MPIMAMAMAPGNVRSQLHSTSLVTPLKTDVRLSAETSRPAAEATKEKLADLANRDNAASLSTMPRIA